MIGGLLSSITSADTYIIEFIPKISVVSENPDFTDTYFSVRQAFIGNYRFEYVYNGNGGSITSPDNPEEPEKPDPIVEGLGRFR